MTDVITSKDNEKLKLVRKLHQRRHREREGLFVTEGEDLLAAGLAAGVEPAALLTLQGEELGGEEVAGDALASVSTLGSGTRAIAVWRQAWAPLEGPVCVYLHRVSDPGNVGAIVRTANALVRGTVVLGPECADPYGPKAVRATMGAIFTQPLARAGIDETPAPRVALTAHGGRPIEELAPSLEYVQERRQTGGSTGLGGSARSGGSAVPGGSTSPADPAPLTQPGALTLCLGVERTGLPPETLAQCDAQLTIPLRPGGAESLNVAAAAAIALHRISSEAAGG
jgi:RNA methyltransferase, TrmH family